MIDVWRMDTATFFQFAGLDALVFRMYLKGCFWICVAALPYSLIVLLPIYATGKNASDDALEMFTVSNCASDSWRLYFTVIGAYISFAIALYYLSKIYLVVAFAADQNYVGNVGNVSSLQQIDHMSWTGYIAAINEIIRFNATVVTSGISKVKGAMDIVAQATGLQQQQQQEQLEEKDIESVKRIAASPDVTDKTSLLKASSYGSTDVEAAVMEVVPNAADFGGNLAVPIDKYTVMIRDLPKQFRTEENLHAFLERLFPNQIYKIFMLYDVKELTDIYHRIQRHEWKLRRMRKKYGKRAVDDSDEPILERNCCHCCGEKKDVKKWHKDELRVLKEQFMDARNNLATSPTAFVTFKDLQAASVSITCPIRFGLYPMKIHQAPAPRDLRWENLKFQTLKLIPNNVLAMFLFGLLLIFWSIPVAAIQALANLESIFDEIGIDLSKYLSSSTISWLV